jgi:hypothetical protein
MPWFYLGTILNDHQTGEKLAHLTLRKIHATEFLKAVLTVLVTPDTQNGVSSVPGLNLRGFNSTMPRHNWSLQGWHLGSEQHNRVSNIYANYKQIIWSTLTQEWCLSHPSCIYMRLIQSDVCSRLECVYCWVNVKSWVSYVTPLFLSLWAPWSS